MILYAGCWCIRSVQLCFCCLCSSVVAQGVADIQHNLSLECNAGAGTDLSNLIKVLHESKFFFFFHFCAEECTPGKYVCSVEILLSLYQNAFLFSLWRLTPVSQWQHLLTGHWGEVVSVSLLGNFTDHPQGKTRLRMITDNDTELFTLCSWKMMTHVDTFWGQKILDYPENVQTVNFCLLYLCIHVCIVLFVHTPLCFFIYCTHILTVLLAPATGSASSMSL